MFFYFLFEERDRYGEITGEDCSQLYGGSFPFYKFLEWRYKSVDRYFLLKLWCSYIYILTDVIVLLVIRTFIYYTHFYTSLTSLIGPFLWRFVFLHTTLYGPQWTVISLVIPTLSHSLPLLPFSVLVFPFSRWYNIPHKIQKHPTTETHFIFSLCLKTCFLPILIWKYIFLRPTTKFLFDLNLVYIVLLLDNLLLIWLSLFTTK